MDTKKKLEQVPSSTNLKQIGVMEVKAKVEMDLGSYLLMFLGKRINVDMATAIPT